jgi:stage II sporulation protein D
MSRALTRSLAALAVSVVGAGAPPAQAQPSTDWIRVAVVRADPQVQVQVSGRFTLLARHTNAPIHQGKQLPSTAVRAVPQGIAWGGEIYQLEGLRIQPEREATISLNGKRLRGALEIVRQKNLTLLVVNYVGLEDYLRGVLSKEAPDYWPAEALNAIAIAARTYALYQRLTKGGVDYDVTGDVMSQDYGGHSGEKHATTKAVDATAGLILTYRGALFPTFYHSTCGGRTEHARVMGDFDLPPLQGGVACGFCTASPFYRWQRRLSKADLGWAIKKSKFGSIGAIKDFRVASRTPSGRAAHVVIRGANQTLKITAFDLRSLLGFERIRSPFFTVVPAADSFVLDGRGWGHGVGMCQWGAAELARRGIKAPEILAFYYPGVQVVKLREIARQPIEVLGGS